MENLTTVEEACTASVVTLSVGDITSPPSVKRKTDLPPLKAFVLTLETVENRWDVEFAKAIRKALQYVKENASASVLVTRSASQKFFSNGLDLQKMKSMTPEMQHIFMREAMLSFADVLDLPIPTICVIQGHAFGAVRQVLRNHNIAESDDANENNRE